MTANEKHFKAFGDHTLLKHAILKSYLYAWGYKQLLSRQRPEQIFFVDAFAGAGQHEAGNPGSPVIACEVAQNVQGDIRNHGATGRMRVIAIEKDPDNCESLAGCLAPFVSADPDAAMIAVGTFGRSFSKVADRVATAPTLYFLDPFGIKGLDAAMYPRMLSGNRNEIFALFDDAGAVRLRGLLHPGADDIEARIAALRYTPTLFPQQDEADEARLRAEAQRKQSKRAALSPAATKTLSRAIDDRSWVEELEGADTSEAAITFVQRFLESLVRAGAQHLVAIPMQDEFGAHKYFLVHASKSPHGYLAMKEAVSSGLRKDSIPASMRERIQADLRLPMDEVLSVLQSMFGGREIRWAGAKDGSHESVRAYLLAYTPVFDFQCTEIKAELRARRWFTKNAAKQEVCRLPAG